MRYVRQIEVILGITLAREILNHVVSLPVLVGMYSLPTMLAALMYGIVELKSVEGTGNFLVDIVTMMSIPATVGIVECIKETRAVLMPFLIIIGIPTLLIMAVTGCMVQWVMGRKHNGEEQRHEGRHTADTGTNTTFRFCAQYRCLSVCLLA